MKRYPEVGDLLKAKAAHRRALAALPFEKKVELAFRLAERRKLIKSGGRAPGDSRAPGRNVR